jgi:chromosome segregation ATPase
MSTPRARAGPPEASELVQQLLTERRELLVANERLRLELRELRAAEAGPDPRLRRMDDENARLRQELAAIRAQLETFEAGVQRAVAQLEAGLQERGAGGTGSVPRRPLDRRSGRASPSSRRTR